MQAGDLLRDGVEHDHRPARPRRRGGPGPGQGRRDRDEQGGEERGRAGGHAGARRDSQVSLPGSGRGRPGRTGSGPARWRAAASPGKGGEGAGGLPEEAVAQPLAPVEEQLGEPVPLERLADRLLHRVLRDGAPLAAPNHAQGVLVAGGGADPAADAGLLVEAGGEGVLAVGRPPGRDHLDRRHRAGPGAAGAAAAASGVGTGSEAAAVHGPQAPAVRGLELLAAAAAAVADEGGAILDVVGDLDEPLLAGRSQDVERLRPIDRAAEAASGDELGPAVQGQAHVHGGVAGLAQVLLLVAAVAERHGPGPGLAHDVGGPLPVEDVGQGARRSSAVSWTSARPITVSRPSASRAKASSPWV